MRREGVDRSAGFLLCHSAVQVIAVLALRSVSGLLTRKIVSWPGASNNCLAIVSRVILFVFWGRSAATHARYGWCASPLTPKSRSWLAAN